MNKMEKTDEEYTEQEYKQGLKDEEEYYKRKYEVRK